jgi:hypothetical protein
VDIISAIEFDKSGEHLATGDRGGRVVLFERTESREVRDSCLLFLITLDGVSVRGEYMFFNLHSNTMQWIQMAATSSKGVGKG